MKHTAFSTTICVLKFCFIINMRSNILSFMLVSVVFNANERKSLWFSTFSFLYCVCGTNECWALFIYSHLSSHWHFLGMVNILLLQSKRCKTISYVKISEIKTAVKKIRKVVKNKQHLGWTSTKNKAYFGPKRITFILVLSRAALFLWSKS